MKVFKYFTVVCCILLFDTVRMNAQDSVKIKWLKFSSISEDVTVKLNHAETLGLGFAVSYFPHYEHPDYYSDRWSGYQYGANIEIGATNYEYFFYGLTLTNNYILHTFQIGFSISYYDNLGAGHDQQTLVVLPFAGVHSLLFNISGGYALPVWSSSNSENLMIYPEGITGQLSFRLAELRMAMTDW